MRVVILLAGDGRRMRPLTWSRPKALLHVAGSTVLGHILHSLEKILNDGVVFVVGDKGEQVREWVQANYPGLDSRFVIQEQPLGEAHALWLCRTHLPADGDVLVVSGNSIVEADYADLAAAARQARVDSVVMVKETAEPHVSGHMSLDERGFVIDFPKGPEVQGSRMVAVGINWYRSSRQLLDISEKASAANGSHRETPFLADISRSILATGGRIDTQEVYQWSDAGRPETLLQTNTRLLSIGLHSADAIERSYAEDFTVLPPVFLHPEARVENAVIGPYASIDAHAMVSHALVSRSILGAGAYVSNCILDGAIVGEHTRVVGRAKALLVGDNSRIELD